MSVDIVECLQYIPNVGGSLDGGLVVPGSGYTFSRYGIFRGVVRGEVERGAYALGVLEDLLADVVKFGAENTAEATVAAVGGIGVDGVDGYGEDGKEVGSVHGKFCNNDNNGGLEFALVVLIWSLDWWLMRVKDL